MRRVMPESSHRDDAARASLTPPGIRLASATGAGSHLCSHGGLLAGARPALCRAAHLSYIGQHGAVADCDYAGTRRKGTVRMSDRPGMPPESGQKATICCGGAVEGCTAAGTVVSNCIATSADIATSVYVSLH